MEIFSPAKINLFLDIIGKRPDGYHELRSLICPVGLYDTIRIRIGGDRIRLRCKANNVPEDHTNLAWKAAEAFCRALERRNISAPAGLEIEVIKQIPAGGGLGGGSGNAAAVLAGLNRLADEPLTSPDLMTLAGTLGADVPFFLLGKPALAEGIGERLTPVEGLTPHPVLIVDPGFSLSTVSVYADLNLALTKCAKRHKNFAFRERVRKAADLLCNDLETAVLPRHPVIGSIKSTLMENGALGSLMAGSGACVFGLFADLTEARRALERISSARKWKLHLVDMIV